MKTRLVMDKTLYVLMGLMIVASTALVGCGKTGEETTENNTAVTVEETVETDGAQGAPQAGDSGVDLEVEEETMVESSEESVAPQEESSFYEDGSYSQTGTYQSPAGPESITVTVQVEDDVVTSLNVTSNATDETSKNFQGLFIAGIGDLVVGKSLDEVGGFGPVNGSSLTPLAFNEAIASIKTSAQN